MTQKTQRIEPTFGQVQENVEKVEEIHETFMPVLDDIADEKVNEKALKESIHTPNAEIETENKISQPEISDKSSISLNSRQIPMHTFEMPLRRPETEGSSEHTVREPLPVSDILSPALQVHNAQLASQQAQQAIKNEQEIAKSESTNTLNTASASVLAGAVAGGAASATLNKTEKPIMTNDLERVIPTASNHHSHEENEPMPKVPSKYRRLLLVILLALLLLLVFFLLKPSATNNGQALQQNNNLPIEFRPVDEAEAQAVEAREAELFAQQQLENSKTQSEETKAAKSTEAAETAEMVEAPQKASVETAPVAQVDRPKTQSSVIHQEEAKVVEKRASQPVRTVEKLKPAPKTETAKPVVKSATAVKENTKAKTVEKPTVKAENSSATVSAGKTMTVPKGVSLMQVFRDNGLSANLSDVNAMSKTNNIVSNLKAGDKVTVKMSGGKVAEMSISSGGKFIRQADGSYRYIK